MTRLQLLLAALTVCLASTLCEAADHFVAPFGSDAAGDGSVDRPFETIGKALDLAQLGDRVLWQNLLSLVRLCVWTPKDGLVNVKRSSAPEPVAAYDLADMNILSDQPLFSERTPGGKGYVVPQ